MTEKVNTHYVTLFFLLDFKRLLELCGASYETPRPIVYAVKFGQKKDFVAYCLVAALLNG